MKKKTSIVDGFLSQCISYLRIVVSWYRMPWRYYTERYQTKWRNRLFKHKENKMVKKSSGTMEDTGHWGTCLLSLDEDLFSSKHRGFLKKDVATWIKSCLREYLDCHLQFCVIPFPIVAEQCQPRLQKLSHFHWKYSLHFLHKNQDLAGKPNLMLVDTINESRVIPVTTPTPPFPPDTGTRRGPIPSLCSHGH